MGCFTFFTRKEQKVLASYNDALHLLCSPINDQSALSSLNGLVAKSQLLLFGN